MLKSFLVLSHTYSRISWSATKSTIRWSRPLDPMYWIGFQGLTND